METKIKNHFGADIDYDVRNYRLSDRSYLVDLMQRYKVLRFRNQSLTPKQLTDFAEILGVLWVNNESGILNGNDEGGHHHIDNDKITLVSNKKHGVLGSKLIPWHCDVSHKPWDTPGGTCPFRILYMVKSATSSTSITSWFDQSYVYRNISEELRNRIENLKVLNEAFYKTNWDGNVMPFVLTDPIDHSKSILLQKIFFKKLLDVSYTESSSIINQLFKVALREENIIKHEWSVGDLIISNSYNTAHKREKLTSTEERTLWRVTFQIPELIPDAVRPNTL
jgi:alpha-ketoglutarate-dependent taurine dioxygenase